MIVLMKIHWTMRKNGDSPNSGTGLDLAASETFHWYQRVYALDDNPIKLHGGAFCCAALNHLNDLSIKTILILFYDGWLSL